MACKNKGWYRSAAKWIGKIKNWYQVAAKCIRKNKDWFQVADSSIGKIIQGLIQEQVYTQIFLNCHLAAFFAWNLKFRKRPNDNLKRFVCILALVSVLVWSYQSNCLQLEISPCSYECTWPQLDISSWSYQSTWPQTDISPCSYKPS